MCLVFDPIRRSSAIEILLEVHQFFKSQPKYKEKGVFSVYNREKIERRNYKLKNVTYDVVKESNRGLFVIEEEGKT